jgi:hypothetical protein
LLLQKTPTVEDLKVVDPQYLDTELDYPNDDEGIEKL